MKRHIALALIALNIFSCFAAPPRNDVAVERSEGESAGVVADRQKGAVGSLESYQNDVMVRTCVNMECKLMSAGAAKALEAGSITAVYPLKGDAAMTKALSPSYDAAMASLKGVQEQQSQLEVLQKEMEALTKMFEGGLQTSRNTKAQFASTMMKGISMPPAFPSKGVAAAALPPSKGGSAAASMQLEAAMCPMTMYELGKSQKLYAETKSQLQQANVMNAMLMKEKNDMANAKAIAEMGKLKAEQQAAFNAKYAAEQKMRADKLTMELAQANQDKAILQQQKAQLEAALAATQQALAEEKATTASLTDALKSCNEEKTQLQEEKAALITELRETQEVLRQTQAALAQEQADHAATRRELAATIAERDAIEAARKLLEEAKQELEDELAETKSQLETMTAERDQLQVTLDATSAMLAKCNEEKMQCSVDLAQEKALSAQLTAQLKDAMELLAAEKKAREDLTALLMSVKDTAEKLQQEVSKLQLENLALKQQLMKLKSEQEAALAMAAGCPPTYEKFGLSCYKYVREKAQWKMAQEQCMKDGGNLVSIESRPEQAFLVDYLKRHGAEKDTTYASTSAYKKAGNPRYWKWLGSNENYVGQSGPEYWYNTMTKNKPTYDCQAMYLRDPSQYGKWVGQPCYVANTYTCEYQLAPAGSPVPPNAAETQALAEMYSSAPSYLSGNAYVKGSLSAAAPTSKGAYYPLPPGKGAMAFAPPSNAQILARAMASKGNYRRY